MTAQLAQSRWHSLEALFSVGVMGDLSDPELLACFQNDRGARGQEAFRILVERHGPMVLGRCRSLIPDPHEAEDAFQATFLVLVRKCRSIWIRDSLGPWLHGVAGRVARRARRKCMVRRRFQAGILDDVIESDEVAPNIRAQQEETHRLIHEVVAGLPARLREPILLCAFQGLTYHAAARRLCLSEPTLRGRLRRARLRLDACLRERGLSSVIPVAPSGLGIEPFRLALPTLSATLIKSTVQHALWWSSMCGLIGQAPAVPASIAALARAALRSMAVSPVRVLALAAILTAGVLATFVSARPVSLRSIDLQDKPAAKAVAQPAVAQKEQAPPATSRVIEGRLTDATGRVVPEGKLMFGPENVRVPFAESGMAPVGPDGRFRIELASFSNGRETLPATGPIRYLILAPGFHAEVGQLGAGAAPVKLDLRLKNEEWTANEIRTVDRNGKPIPGANVTVQMGGEIDWSKHTTDFLGKCRFESARGQAFSISISRDGYLLTRFGSRATAEDPTSFTIPLYSPIVGRVVDTDGKPLAGIQVGRLIAPNYDAGLDKPTERLEVAPMAGSTKPVITGSDGVFRLTPRINLDFRTGKMKVWPMAVCLADEAQRRLCFLRVDLQDEQKPYEITLRPARQVRILISHQVAVASGALEGWWELSDLAGASGSDPGIFVMQGLVKKPEPGRDSNGSDFIEAYWPVGKYRVKVNTVDPAAHAGAEETETDVTIPPGETPLVLAPIAMKVLPQRGLIGQPAPELDAKDLRTGAPVELADYKGKVVVLDFWGYWCGPCIGAMPELISAYDRYKDKPVAIVAVHDQSIQSAALYDRRMKEVIRQAWNNRELPFAVALDTPEPDVPAGDSAIGRGMTCKRYEIKGFPTTLVIDQEGKVVGSVEVREKGRLDATIDEALKKGGR